MSFPKISYRYSHALKNYNFKIVKFRINFKIAYLLRILVSKQSVLASS